MVNTQWLTAAPLWPAAAPSTGEMRRPALLRFSTDAFMDDLNRLLNTSPETLAGHRARKESFRARPAGARQWNPSPALLKLYQPVHGHFCLVAANLVCRLPGLPDHTVNPGRQEKAGFVIRRLSPSREEMAWVDSSGRKQWRVLTSAQTETVAPSEELLPLFPISFSQDGVQRRLLAGMIPTSSRETFQAAGPLNPVATDPASPDPRVEEMKRRVFDPWRELKSAKPLPATLLEEATSFILLDLADFLSTHLPAEWAAIQQGDPNSLGMTAALSTALVNALNQWERIHGLATPKAVLNIDIRTANVNAIETTVKSKLAPASAPALPLAELPKYDATDGAAYIVRCVYQRPVCRPPHADVVSLPSEPFTLASFFDPDAPARPLRISLPVDTSPAGLRSFPKNVAFLVSDRLRTQMEAVSGLKKTLDGDVGGPAFDLGELCSMSIPIITICAFIVLMIFVALLNIVFWWLPLLRVCLPLRLKAR